MRQVYPILVIDTKDDSEHPFLVCVPDLDILTEGSDFADAIEMARDAIALSIVSMEDAKEDIPVPSDASAAIKKAKQYDEVDFSNGLITYVDVDTTEYRRKIDNRTVRRNVALPSWLNYEAEKSGINVSRILQEALMNVLGVQKKI